jgi:DNA-directed RNA polymerase specialized sigma24 family protein
MLMKTHSVDFHYVSDAHREIDQHLQEWARWVKVRPGGWQSAPMWRNYRSHAWQWHQPVIQTPVNTLRAHDTEKAVAKLPDKHRAAIRWSYIWRNNPIQAARGLGVSKEGLLQLVVDGRTMLINRGMK